ncbi:hypothetical protein FNV58_01395 (plasmid) [Streptomyces sp. RLB1-9]|uniref:hypothetical protein n=1 Tax=Streptomyces sp. RLB1-9 TaxID=2594454 RepID=UPI001161D38C|nr:hypothetical protein [Streptomyces sp. RLB1-9]QDN95016.1 hypothetical protein FNV58_01395 [Streptomyces sp. RLB1-9]
MSMSDHERALLVTGTLDTSGVGGSPYANLDQVAVAFGAEVFEGDHIPQETPVKTEPEPEQKAAENGPSEPVKEPEVEAKVEEKAATTTRAKRAPAKKAQAPAPADK